MPGPYPPSNFAAGVAGFLQGYGTVKGFQHDAEDAKARKEAAQRAKIMEQVQLDQSGYDLLTTPTTEGPPPQNFEQHVARLLSDHFGSKDQPTEFAVKTHPSTRETDVANEQAFTTSRDTAHFQNEKDIESLKEAIATNRANATIAAENKRSAANNATSLQVAGIDHSVQAQALADRQRTEFFNNAVSAAGGDAVQAMKNVEQYQMPQARKFGATRTDYHAAAARYHDSKAALTREQIDAANERAASRGGSGNILPRDINGTPIPPPAPAGTGGASGNITLPVSSSPAQPTPAATPNAAGPTSAFPPEQAQAIGTLAAGIRAGHATLDQLRGKVPDAVYQAVTKLRALTPAEKTQAARDPQFKGWLLQHGYMENEF